jgi:hypothetical protein
MTALKRSYCHVIAPRSGVEALLRNYYPVELLSGVEIDEREAERGGALAQTAKHSRVMVRVIRRSPRGG